MCASGAPAVQTNAVIAEVILPRWRTNICRNLAPGAEFQPRFGRTWPIWAWLQTNLANIGGICAKFEQHLSIWVRCRPMSAELWPTFRQLLVLYSRQELRDHGIAPNREVRTLLRVFMCDRALLGRWRSMNRFGTTQQGDRKEAISCIEVSRFTCVGGKADGLYHSPILSIPFGLVLAQHALALFPRSCPSQIFRREPCICEPPSEASSCF